LQNLKALGEILLDIHGQHFHQSLVRRSVQCDLLDYFGALVHLRAATEAAFHEWQALARQLDELESANLDRAARLELLGFQSREFASLNAKPGEFTELQAERRMLQNSGRLADAVNNAIRVVYDGEPDNAQRLLAEARRAIEAASAFDARLQPVLGLLTEAGIQVSEACDSLRRYADSLDAINAVIRWRRLAAIRL
jgi:DNA repair protein RecN (Recombination protein N)